MYGNDMLVSNIGYAGILMWTSLIAYPVENNIINDNTIINNGTENASIFVMGDYPPRPNSFNNNIFRNNKTLGNQALKAIFGAENDGVNGSGNIYEYNCFGPETTGFIEWRAGNWINTYNEFNTLYGSDTYSCEKTLNAPKNLRLIGS